MVSIALKADETPYLLWYGKKPNLEHIRVFGCIVYSHIPSENRKKLDKKAQKLRDSLAILKQPEITKYGMKKSVNATYIMMLFSMKMILERVQILIN